MQLQDAAANTFHTVIGRYADLSSCVADDKKKNVCVPAAVCNIVSMHKSMVWFCRWPKYGERIS